MEINLAVIGVIVIIIGIILVVLSGLQSKNVKVGFGGFIGPVPFGWANDPQMLKWVIVITAVVAIVFMVLFLSRLL